MSPKHRWWALDSSWKTNSQACGSLWAIKSRRRGRLGRRRNRSRNRIRFALVPPDREGNRRTLVGRRQVWGASWCRRCHRSHLLQRAQSNRWKARSCRNDWGPACRLRSCHRWPHLSYPSPQLAKSCSFSTWPRTHGRDELPHSQHKLRWRAWSTL